jgi:hypothetical protein
MSFPSATQYMCGLRARTTDPLTGAAKQRGPIPPGWQPHGGSYGPGDEDDGDVPGGGGAGFDDGPPGDEDDGMPPQREPRYRNTIGSIVSWAIIRAAIVIAIAWALYEFMSWKDYGIWWMVTAMAMYAIVVHPITVQYRLYREETRAVIDGTLCSSCRYFEETGVLCTKLDRHVSADVIPCEGELWEPRSRGPAEDWDDD